MTWTDESPGSPGQLPRRSLARFSGRGYDRGRSPGWQVAWLLVSGLVLTHWWCPAALRVTTIRLFGGEVGRNVLVRHRVRIHWPWKLVIGDDSWIGEGTWILNLEPVTIGSDVCISQDVVLCSGSHDRRSPSFEFDNAPVVIEDGVWVALRATILRGCVIGHDSVIGAGALVTTSVAPHSLVLAPRAAENPR